MHNKKLQIAKQEDCTDHKVGMYLKVNCAVCTDFVLLFLFSKINLAQEGYYREDSQPSWYKMLYSRMNAVCTDLFIPDSGINQINYWRRKNSQNLVSYSSLYPPWSCLIIYNQNILFRGPFERNLLYCYLSFRKVFC